MKPDEKLPEAFSDFLQSEHVLNLSCHENHIISYSVSVFYVRGEEPDQLIFFSSRSTHHSELILENPHVSGTIHHNTKNIEEIRGMQFSGICLPVTEPEEERKCREIYGKHFPAVHRISDPPWIIHLQWIKLTDNRVAFGHKTEWGVRNDLSD